MIQALEGRNRMISRIYLASQLAKSVKPRSAKDTAPNTNQVESHIARHWASTPAFHTCIYRLTYSTQANINKNVANLVCWEILFFSWNYGRACL